EGGTIGATCGTRTAGASYELSQSSCWRPFTKVHRQLAKASLADKLKATQTKSMVLFMTAPWHMDWCYYPPQLYRKERAQYGRFAVRVNSSFWAMTKRALCAPGSS